MSYYIDLAVLKALGHLQVTDGMAVPTMICFFPQWLYVAVAARLWVSEVQ